MLQELLDFGRKYDCSDLHLTIAKPPVVRQLGALKETPFPTLSKNELLQIIETVCTQQQVLKFSKAEDIDTSYQDQNGLRYRINIYHQRNAPCIAIRLLRDTIPQLHELQLPSVVTQLTQLSRGLILVTGPTGSGKSTTMAAMLHEINQNKKCHIITVEDPIEYMHMHQNSLIHQREVGRDVPSFADALRSALREDPDVILVGEMRDFETISAALTAAETGHLVISTLHTNSAVSTIDRIIDVFPQHQQQQIRIQLAATLKAVITQQLLPRADGSGRIAAHEILLMTDAVSSMIRENKGHQIPNVIQTNVQSGMQLMDLSLARLIKQNLITYDTAIDKCQRIDQLKQLMML